MSARVHGITRGRATARVLAMAWPAWLVAIICAIAALGGDPWRLALRFQRDLILDGQWWRLVTGNIVHMDTSHLLMDLTGLALLWILCEPVLAGVRWLIATAVGMLAVGCGLLWFAPQIAWYVGISGVLHTYWAAGALLLVTTRRREGWLLIAGLVVKLIWEQTAGPMPFSEAVAGGPVVTAAHLWGAVGGILVGLAFMAANQFKSTKKAIDAVSSNS